MGIKRRIVEDQVTVPRGTYSLAVHEAKEQFIQSEEHLKSLLGPDDFAYFWAKEGRSGWFGCLTIVVVALSLLVQWIFETFAFWYVTLGTIVAWLIYRFIRRWFRDERYEKLAERVRKHTEEFPYFIFSLTMISEPTEIEGGWYDLVAR